MIEQQTDQLEDLRKEFPASWFDIKTHVAEMKENYITFDRYRDICKQYGETDFQAQDTLASHLHDLGIALNYKKDSRLRDTHVLNPSWVTNGIYTLINNSSLAKNKGEVKPEQLATILDPQNYPPERHLFLLELMRKFELCFRFPEEDDRYLIPDLLDKQQPQEVDEFKHEECLNFQYIYPISPERLLPRFIVRTRVLSTQELCWRTGVILQFEGCRALVKADRQDKRITITIDGKLEERRRLLGIIRSDFEHIHHSFAFEPEEKVPIPGHPKISVSYQDLLVLERDEVEQLPFVINGQIQKFSVKNLLNGVDFQRTQKPLKLFYIYSHKDEALRDQLATRLKLLERQGFIDSWHDRQITAGDEWREKLDKNLDQADIILLLISSDFLASDYCYEIEMKRALEKHNNSESIVIPIILRDCSWQQSPFGKLQALPENGKAITRWDDREEAWSSVEKGIQSIQLQQKTLLISRLKLENICCFSELNLELCSPQETPLFAIILGENGVGKTTLLRSIAIGLADEGEGIALISDAANNMIKENSDSASIVIELRSSISNRSYSITTLLKRDLEGTINLEKKYSPEFPRHQLFVCGYGAMRRGFGTGGYSNYTLAHAVKTLFDYGISLQNPELALRRIDAKGIPVTTLTSRIDGVLLLEPGSTSLDSSGIQISGPWGDFQPIATLGDGYQATLAWLADLLGWVLLYDHKLLTSKISGIVLIDELEQHLHPSWQRQIIEQLHQQFPDIQFIAATHSPVCAGGLADLEPDEATILRIYRDEKKCIQYEVIPSLAGYRYDQILTSDAFGLPSPRDATTEKLINRLRELYESSGSDSPEFQQVMDKLNDRSADAAEDEHDRQVRLKIAQDLEEFKNSSSQKPVV
jgi:internalin A